MAPKKKTVKRDQTLSITLTKAELLAVVKESNRRTMADGKRVSASDIAREAIRTHLGLD